MQARYYDPVIGRFLSIDPMPFMAAKPYMFNRYAYTGNNPMNRTDPTGMADDSDSDFDDDWGMKVHLKSLKTSCLTSG